MPVHPQFTLVVMGVSGCGKSTVGELVAARTGSEFADADDFHPPANREKMARGLPLDDDDRQPWLEALRDHIRSTNEANRTLVLACSALKRSYRDTLREAGPQVAFVSLDGTRDQLLARLNGRSDHFFPPALLDSQLATLERPRSALVLNISSSPTALARAIQEKFFTRQL